MILEVGKSYRLNNGWKLTVNEQLGVDHFCGRIDKFFDGIETLHSTSSHYNRNGTLKGCEDNPKDDMHVSYPWSELGTSGRTDVDGWDTERFRKAIANSGLFNF